VNDKRHGLSVISAVTSKGQMRWKAFDGALDQCLLELLDATGPAVTAACKGGSKRTSCQTDSFSIEISS
jgi:hypothetical protein